MLRLNLENCKTVEEAAAAENGTLPAGDVNHGTKVLK